MTATEQTAAPAAERFRARLDRVRERMSQLGLDLLFLPPGADLRYLTGAPAPRPALSPGGDLFLVAACDALFVSTAGAVATTADSVWSHDAAEALAGWPRLEPPRRVRTWELYRPGDAVALFRRAGAELGVAGGTIGVGDSTPLSQLELLRQAFPTAALVPAGDLVLALRLRKDPAEVALLRLGQEACRDAVNAALRRAAPGITAGELAAELDLQLVRHGATGACFPADLYAVGATTVTYADPPAVKARAVLRARSALCIDVGGVFDGYCTDFARTAFFGEPAEKHLDALRAVREAQAGAIGAIAPGVSGHAVDRAARDVVEAAGLGEAFWTGAGHGIGLQVHEPPALMPGIDQTVEAGMVLAVEVGAWVDGEIGAFVEDLVLVTETGAVRLDDRPDDPLVVQ